VFRNNAIPVDRLISTVQIWPK